MLSTATRDHGRSSFSARHRGVGILTSIVSAHSLLEPLQNLAMNYGLLVLSRLGDGDIDSTSLHAKKKKKKEEEKKKERK